MSLSTALKAIICLLDFDFLFSLFQAIHCEKSVTTPNLVVAGMPCSLM